MASNITTSNQPHHRRVTVADFNELFREENERANPEIPATQAHSSSTAQSSRGLNKPSTDATIIDQPLREEIELAPPELPAILAPPTSLQPSRGGNERTSTRSSHRQTKPAMAQQLEAYAFNVMAYAIAIPDTIGNNVVKLTAKHPTTTSLNSAIDEGIERRSDLELTPQEKETDSGDQTKAPSSSCS
ncbi:hypothetical protein B0H65DRAFT_575510 [Neurospora tetraspora]|uniref:Uncharacterized protein n=1 Tax=Neurospora tetraspora TaxID=94610 RepID=A0AAE0JC67_9PEZI|nr:hypothetical protein B0H65DRAFT_575510 [Neurospora tetraspora]